MEAWACIFWNQTPLRIPIFQSLCHSGKLLEGCGVSFRRSFKNTSKDKYLLGILWIQTIPLVVSKEKLLAFFCEMIARTPLKSSSWFSLLLLALCRMAAGHENYVDKSQKQDNRMTGGEKKFWQWWPHSLICYWPSAITYKAVRRKESDGREFKNIYKQKWFKSSSNQTKIPTPSRRK